MCCAERPRPGRELEAPSAFASFWSTSAAKAGPIARLLDTTLTVVGLAQRAIAPEQGTTGYAALQMITRQFVVKEALIARQGGHMSTDRGTEEHSDQPIVVGPDEGNLRWFMSTLFDMKVYGEHTNGAFSLIDTLVAPNSLAAPPHIHEAMDEGSTSWRERWRSSLAAANR